MVDSDRVGEWLALRAAAARLGISEKTLRRRVKAGHTEGRQVGTQHGPAWQVWVPMTTPQATLDGQGTHVDQGPGLLELVRLVDRLQTDVRERSEAATVWQARAEMLAHQLAASEDRLRALEAPRTHVAPHLTAQPDEPTTEPSEPPSPRVPAPIPPSPNGSSWWRRWWATLAGAGLVL